MDYQEKGAVFSDCGKYRFMLWRVWDEFAPKVLFVCINPSKAGVCVDDPTVKRCIGFAKRAGYGGLYLVNLFGLVSTDPAGLFANTNPTGNPDNDNYIHKAAAQCTNVIVAWGEDGSHLGRDHEIIRLLKTWFPQILCLEKMVSGQPRHPGRLSDSCVPMLF
jgi:hypothetical protein